MFLKAKKTEEDFQGKPWLLIATASCNQQALLHFVGFQKRVGAQTGENTVFCLWRRGYVRRNLSLFRCFPPQTPFDTAFKKSPAKNDTARCGEEKRHFGRKYCNNNIFPTFFGAGFRILPHPVEDPECLPDLVLHLHVGDLLCHHLEELGEVD